MERERIIYQTWHLAAKRMSRVNTLDFCYIIVLYHNEMADLIPPYLRAKSPMQQVGLNMELHNPVAHQFDHRLPYSNGSFEEITRFSDFQVVLLIPGLSRKSGRLKCGSCAVPPGGIERCPGMSQSRRFATICPWTIIVRSEHGKKELLWEGKWVQGPLKTNRIFHKGTKLAD